MREQRNLRLNEREIVCVRVGDSDRRGVRVCLAVCAQMGFSNAVAQHEMYVPRSDFYVCAFDGWNQKKRGADRISLGLFN